MRRGVAPDPEAGATEHRVQRGDRAALAVRSGYVKDRIGPLRRSDGSEQRGHTLEPEAPDAARSSEQAAERRVVRRLGIVEMRSVEVERRGGTWG
jgi:hypothetical protein